MRKRKNEISNLQDFTLSHQKLQHFCLVLIRNTLNCLHRYFFDFFRFFLELKCVVTAREKAFYSDYLLNKYLKVAVNIEYFISANVDQIYNPRLVVPQYYDLSFMIPSDE